MKTTPIRSVKKLKELAKNKQIDVAIALNGGAFSRKEIYYFPEKNIFEVFNGIDSTMQTLTPDEISDPKSEITNIGLAMSRNSLALLNYD